MDKYTTYYKKYNWILHNIVLFSMNKSETLTFKN